MVPASELLDLGIGLMDTCDRGRNETYKATRYRDGLMIALLICCPMRLKNLASLVIGQHLMFDGSPETKSGRRYHGAISAS
jgi:integrase/recombinase XerD